MATLKGRKRFLVDFDAVAAACATGYGLDGLLVKDFRKGEDDGSFTCIVCDKKNQKFASLTFLVSDTSDYPKYHTFYCFSLDEDPPSYVQQVIETVTDYASLAIDALLEKVLKALARRITSIQNGAEPDEDEDVEIDDGHFDADFDIATLTSTPGINVHFLQRDFNEIVAQGYRPGLIRLSSDEIVLSVSIPVISLASKIEPRALMAWDSRLLSQSRYLTLIISGMRRSYPVLQSDGTFFPSIVALGIANLQFQVGLTAEYKPGKELVLALIRKHGLQSTEEGFQLQSPASLEPDYYLDGDESEDESDDGQLPEEGIPSHEDNINFDFPFSLSTSLETLLHDRFLQALQLRLNYKFGWAAAELLINRADQLQQKTEAIIQDHHVQIELLQADAEERQLATSYKLPADPLLEQEPVDHLNLPLLAFSYLIRRLMLCSRYCPICYNRLQVNFEALKPYVCDSKLCRYQYYRLNRGPSLEYEIRARPETVDLLVSLAYCAAASRVLNDPLPTGMGLEVPHPSDPNIPRVDFDTLSKEQMCKSITDLLNTLPPIREMREYLEKNYKKGRAKCRLANMNANIEPAAWLLLRWCVASCTAHIEQLSSPEDRIVDIDSQWRQFRFTIGAPDAEEKFRQAQHNARAKSANADKYPSIYAFHGSPTENWHSIIRHGLWFKTIAHGRAYGDGVYFAKDGGMSISGYSRVSSHKWQNSELGVGQCVALAEIVNLPHEFAHNSNSVLVVQHTEWIVCRYLLVNCSCKEECGDSDQNMMAVDVPNVTLDPAHPLSLNKKRISIPEPSLRLQRLLEARRYDLENAREQPDEEDTMVFYGIDSSAIPPATTVPTPVYDTSVHEEVPDNWKHSPAWLASCVEHLLPPPTDASPMATMAVQRELKAMLREQDSAKSLETLGWYMPPDMVGDNLFQWIVEIHSFDPQLPIAQDMERLGVNSLVFEILFPPTFPHSPPFFRILKPRFLPFLHGGGGHVTAGGSMCMDLLTADGWLPSYSIPAVILQIKLAISNLDPRPARLSQQWNVPYSMREAIEGFKRAAATHGWKVPDGLERLAR